MKFNEWTIDSLIEWLHLLKSGLDPHCKMMCFGEIHLYNGERKDGKPQEMVDDEAIDDKSDIPQQEKLSAEEFYEKFCLNCGSQRCEGIGTDWFEGCEYKELLKEEIK